MSTDVLNNIYAYCQMQNEKFIFANAVKTLYGSNVIYSTMKAIYAPKTTVHGRLIGNGTDETKKMGVYALYYNNELKKIGKASDKNGIFHRMGQYYRGDKRGGSKFINKNNRDDIFVEYIQLDSTQDCWIIERILQGIAYYKNETMPWEEKSSKENKNNGKQL